MIHGNKIVAVMPAYNAEHTLRRTYREIPGDIVDGVLLVDDGSSGRTVEIARTLGIKTIPHGRNLGYGANQKTCHALALGEGADAVYFGFRIGELRTPARYEPDSSSISFSGSLRYGCGVIRTSMQYALARRKLARYPYLDPNGRKVAAGNH